MGALTRLAGIDAGGTTFKCVLADGQGTILARSRVPVTTPGETLEACVAFFREALRPDAGALSGFGLASFGPLDIDPASARYGCLLDTPKPGWAGTDLRGAFVQTLGAPLAIDTDVNGALLAELTHEQGAARGCQSAAYITIGTGIGAGLLANGAMLGRPSHPEFGHIAVRRHALDAGFDGVCPFHGDCLEGMASASAMRARWGDPAGMAPDHPGWEVIADYLAQACRSLTLTLRPQRIVLGGGVMLAPHLIGRVREAYDRQMAGYLGKAEPDTAHLITTPGLGDDAGLMGALELARRAAMGAGDP
jgi:fructokinase